MHFVLDENNNKVEAYDKEEVLSVLEQAIADGSLENLVADAAFVTKLKCCVGGDTHQVAFIPQAKYNELKASNSLVDSCLYIITDDTTASGINNLLTKLSNTVNNMINGTQQVGKVDPAQLPLTLNMVPEFGKTYAQLKADYDANKAVTDETRKDEVYKTEAPYSVWYDWWSKKPTVGEMFTATGTSNDGYVFGFLGRVVKVDGNIIRFAFDDLVLFHDAGVDADVKGIKSGTVTVGKAKKAENVDLYLHTATLAFNSNSHVTDHPAGTVAYSIVLSFTLPAKEAKSKTWYQSAFVSKGRSYRGYIRRIDYGDNFAKTVTNLGRIEIGVDDGTYGKLGEYYLRSYDEELLDYSTHEPFFFKSWGVQTSTPVPLNWSA